jgi:antitoxin MazE
MYNVITRLKSRGGIGKRMANVVKSHLVRIGNSRGVRIPKIWLEQLNLGEEVELAVEADQVVIRSGRRPRQGWDEQFRAMHERGDDRPTDEFPATTWDKEEWEW